MYVRDAMSREKIKMKTKEGWNTLQQPEIYCVAIYILRTLIERVDGLYKKNVYLVIRIFDTWLTNESVQAFDRPYAYHKHIEKSSSSSLSSSTSSEYQHPLFVSLFAHLSHFTICIQPQENTKTFVENIFHFNYSHVNWSGKRRKHLNREYNFNWTYPRQY